jgi:peptide/nickel transport system substrate-binding protein
MRVARLAAVLGLFLIGSIAGPATLYAQQAGGTLVWLVHPEPADLGVHASVAPEVAQIAAKIYDGLIEYGSDLEPLPALAESWQVAADGRSIRFRLRQGVTFHDGQPFTSADVQFSIMDVLRLRHPRGIATFRKVTAVETPDPLTAIVRLADPAPYLLSALGGHESPMLPRHLLAKPPAGPTPPTEASMPPAIGTGPFKLASWRRGESLRLERNAKYWRVGLPLLDAITVRFEADARRRHELIESGGVHVAGHPTLPIGQASRLRQSVADVAIEAKGHEWLAPMAEIAANTRRAPFDKAEVRQAIAAALDRQAIVASVWAGFAKPAELPVALRRHERIRPSKAKPPTEVEIIERAGSLLDAAGFARGDDGTRLELTLDVAPFGPEWQAFAGEIEQQLARVGIKVALRFETAEAWLERIFARGDFELTTHLGYGLTDPVLGLHRALHGKAIGAGPFMNAARWSDPRVDALLDRAAIEMEPRVRARLYAEAGAIVAAASPIIFVADLAPPAIVDRRVRDVVTRPLGLYTNFAAARLDLPEPPAVAAAPETKRRP